MVGNTGGSIGIALPLAVGVAVAAPDRRVLCLTSDGSAMYTVQALWTMVRESLKVTTVVLFANGTFAVLKREFSYLGACEPGPQAQEIFDIGKARPRLGSVGKRDGSSSTALRRSMHSGKRYGKDLRVKDRTLIEIPL